MPNSIMLEISQEMKDKLRDERNPEVEEYFRKLKRWRALSEHSRRVFY